MRIIFIGCVESSYLLLQELLTVSEAEVVGIVTRKESSFNADFQSLEPIAEEYDIPCFFDEGNQQGDMTDWLHRLRPDVGYCFGWSYLLKPDVLSIPERGFVGYHPAALPRNRGRHPIIWALALGLEKTASSFFFMDEEADAGDILSQREVPIYDDDDARSLYDHLIEIAREQVATFTPRLASGNHPREPQDDAEANYWRKRGYEDGQIDWRMSARSIYNLVRALTRPYPGAHCTVNGKNIKIWVAEVADEDFDDADHLEPGKVLGTNSDEGVVVKCGEGAVRLLEHEFADGPEEGQYL